MPDRIRDALTLPLVHHPGAYYEYAQSPVTLLAEAVRRAVGEDALAFFQRELIEHLGIRSSDWGWSRDPAGHLYGFWGVTMRPDDYGRVGELLRRGGVWRGKRLLSARYMREALSPAKVNGCYGWLIWLNAAAPCIGPTVGNRPVDNSREYPELPADMYHFSGLFGQLVTVFPSQGIVLVRTGQDPGLVPAGNSSWQLELYKRVLAAVADQQIVAPGAAPRVNEERQDVDYGFQTSAARPDEYNKGMDQDPLPPAGPGRARAPQLELAWTRPKSNGRVGVRLFCPLRWSNLIGARCLGRATLTGARKKARYSVAPGKSTLLRFKLTRKRLRALRRARTMSFDVTARNADSTGGTFTRTDLDIRVPKRVRKR
jgi:Beta-lactamase